MFTTLCLIAATFAQSAPPEGDVLSGAVKSDTGKPIRGASVVICTAGLRGKAPAADVGVLAATSYPDCGKRTLTDGDGGFAISGLDPHLVYRILVRADGFSPHLSKAPTDPRLGPASVTLESHDLGHREPEELLRGRVVDDKKKPVADAMVVAKAIQTGEDSWRGGALKGLVDPLAVTNERGEFTLGTKEKGAPVIVEVRALALAPQTAAGPFSPGAKVHEIQLVPGAAVTGKIMKNAMPIAGAILQISSTSTGQLGERVDYKERIATGKDGSFVFSNLPPERSYLLIGLLDSCSKYGVVPDQEFHAGTSGAREDLGQLVIRPGHSLSGRLVLPEEKPLPAGTRVMLTRHEHDRPIDSLTANVGEDGKFSFSGLPSARYWLIPRVNGYHLSKKNVSYDLLSSLTDRLVGTVDHDLKELRFLMEIGARSASSKEDMVAGEELNKRFKENQRRAEASLGGV